MSQMSSTQRSTCWSVTINNPTADDEECIALARQLSWQVEGQLEKGKEGTPHYQLMVKTPQVRFSALKKVFPRAHIEVAREPAALRQYVAKEDTRAGALPESQAMYPSLSKFWQLIVDEINDYNAHIIPQWMWDADRPVVGRGRITVTGADNFMEEWCGYPLPKPDELYWQMVGRLIEKGYHVETIAVNPQTLTCWKRLHMAIIIRVLLAEKKAALEAEDSVSVPMVNADQTPPRSSSTSPRSSSEAWDA